MNNNFLLIFAILLVFKLEVTKQYSTETTKEIKALTQKGNLKCQGSISALSFLVENERNMNLDNFFCETIKSSHSQIDLVTSKSISLETIKSLSRENLAVKINSLIKVTGDITYENDNNNNNIPTTPLQTAATETGNNSFTELNSLAAKAVKSRDYFNNPVLDLDNLKKMSFIQIENIYIDNVRQWKLKKEEDLSELSKSFSKFILENLISQQKDSLEINKTISLLDYSSKSKEINRDFESLMFELNFKFTNLLWNNSTAYLKVNEDFYWMEHHNWEAADCSLDSWVNPIRFVIRKNQIKNDQIKLTFGIKANLYVHKKIKEIKGCEFSLEKLDINKRNVIEFGIMQVSSR